MIALVNHPKIQEILDSESIDKKLYFKHQSSFYKFLNLYVQDALSQSKSLLFTINKKEDIEDLEKALSSFLPYIYVHKSHDIPLQSISKLRVRNKRKTSYLNYLEFENLQTKEKQVNSYIQAAYESSYNSENNQFSLNKLLKSQRADVTNIHVPIFEHYIPPHIFEGSEIELSYLTDIISWASRSYDHTYRSFSECSLFGSYEAQQFTDKSFAALKQHLDKANELIILFLNNLNEYKESDSNHKIDTCKRSNELLTQLNGIQRKTLKVDQLLDNNEGNLLSKWSSKIKSNNTKSIYSENIELEFDHWLSIFKESFPSLYQEYAMVEESTLVPNLLVAKNLLSDHNILLQKQDKKINGTYIEQLNIHNCPDIFKEIIEELKGFYSEISQSGLVHMPVSDNSFNIINSYEYLLRVRNKINDIITLENQQPHFFTWKKRFEQCSHLEKLVLETLITFFPDRDAWVTIFRDYYHYALSKSLLVQPENLERNMLTSEDLQSKINDLQSENIAQLDKEKLDTVSTHLKEIDLSTFKTLFKKKYNPTDLNLTTNEQFKLIQSLFPITIMAEDKWNDLNQVQQNWDMHIHIDSSQFETVEEKFKVVAENQLYIKHPIDEFKLRDKDTKENTFIINFDSSEYLKHPKLRTDNDQLNFSRSLSSKLEEYFQRIQIFQLENQYVISFLDKNIILNFLEIHQQHTIKKFVLDHDLNYSLSDILLVGTDNITVMVQDHLLDPHNYQSFKWQRYLISLMSRAGMTIRDVSMKSIFNKDYTDLFIPMDQKPQHQNLEMTAESKQGAYAQ